MPINYGLDGKQSVNWHYKTRLISSYQNKLFYNIFTKGVIPESGILSLVNDEGITTTENINILIPSGFSFFISPNNRNTTNATIQSNFNVLSDAEKNIVEKQLLKCDIVNDFFVTPVTTGSGEGYLVAEYNYLEFSDLPVSFSLIITSIKPTDNRVVLAKITFSGGYLTEIDFTNQDICNVERTIPYEMNVDMIDNHHAGTGSGYIPVSNLELCYGLNTEMVNGYSGYNAALKWEMNSGFNVEYMADEFAVKYAPGFTEGSIPLSNGWASLNVGLNSEYLHGMKYNALAEAIHYHYLEEILEGPISYRRPVGVNANFHLTANSFQNGAFTRDKIDNQCFFTNNDDDGGKIRIITGQKTLTASGDVIEFSPRSQAVFEKNPCVMLQIIDDGTGNYDGYHIKIRASEISTSTFKVDYTIYKADDNSNYFEESIENLIIQYVVFGYVNEDVEF